MDLDCTGGLQHPAGKDGFIQLVQDQDQTAEN